MLLGGGSSPLPSHCLWAPSRTSQVFINKLLWFSQGSSASIAPSGWNLASGTGTDAFLGTLIDLQPLQAPGLRIYGHKEQSIMGVVR